MESMVEKSGDEGGREERAVVGGLEGDDEEFEEAREQLPHVKAIAGVLNEEEVYVTPVFDFVATTEVEGVVFEDVIEVYEVGDVNRDWSDHAEDVESVGSIKSGFSSGGKTYTKVLVEKLDDTNDRKTIVDIDNGGKTESLQLGNGKEKMTIDGFGGRTSESANSNESENNNEASRLGDRTNGELSEDRGHIEELKGVDRKSRSFSGVDREDVEGENIIRAYTSSLLGIEDDMPDSFYARDAIHIAGDTSEDEDYLYDFDFDGEDPQFRKTMADILESLNSGTFIFPPYDAIFENDMPASFCMGKSEVKEVDSQSLLHARDDTTEESEVNVAGGSVIGADQTSQGFEGPYNMKDIVVDLDPCNPTEEPLQGSTALKESSVDQPDLVTDSWSALPSSAEIQGELHTVSDVTQRNQAISEVLKNKYVTENELKQHSEAQELSASVTDFFSEQSSAVDVQVKLHTESDVFQNNHATAEVLEGTDVVKKELKQQNIVQEIPVSETSCLAEKLSEAEIQGNLHTFSNVSQGNQASFKVLESKDVSEKKVNQQNKAQEIPASVPASSSPTLPARPAGLGRAAPLLEPAPCLVQQPRVNGSVSQAQAQLVEEAANGENEENDETREKLQMIRVKFLRLARRLGQTQHNVVVAQVLYRLGLTEQLRGRTGGRVAAFSFDRASEMAEQLEAVGQEPLNFSCTIMVLGKTGVGKSATINSIFDEVKFETDAFQSGTKKVQDVVGTVQGIKVRVIDTPGLLTSWSDQRQNEKILQSVKQFIKKTPPDIVLYLDRLDMQSREFGDMLLLRTITRVFGPSIWFNAIVVLTHAGSAPPDEPDGTASNYDTFVTQRSHVVQHAVCQAAGDMRLMNPVSLVENHSACRTNRAGQRVLHNGQVWKPHLLLLSFAAKILAEANTLLKLQDGPPGSTRITRSRAPYLPYLLSSMLQPRLHLRLPEDQMSGNDSLDDDLEDSSGSEDDSENVEDEDGAAASAPVLMRDLALPASFDSDNPTHRYGYLDSFYPWLVMPVLETQGWDHDVGYEGINVERSFVVIEKVPLSFSGQVKKDKKDANVQMEVAGTLKHGEGKATSVCLDLQTVEKEIEYTFRSESTFCNFLRNKATAGVSFTLLGDAVSAGMKLEDKLIATKSFSMVLTGGAMTNRGDIAYGGSLEATLKDKDHPLGRSLSTLGLSVMDWDGDLAIGCNLQSQIPIGRHSNIIARANLNNDGSGQVSIRLNSVEQLQIALVALLPLLRKAFSYWQ